MYAVIDVEQADTRFKGSICSIGIVYVEGHTIVDTFYSLVRPAVAFSPFCTSVHHITAELVQDAPTFKELWPSLAARLVDTTLVAYRAETDIYALEKALCDAGIEAPSLNYADAYRIVSSLLNLPCYRLGYVSERLGIPLLNAHNALDDAYAAAQVMLKLQSFFNTDDLSELLDLCSLCMDNSKTNHYIPEDDHPKPHRPIHAEIAEPVELSHGNSDYFSGKTVVFTGDLHCTTRSYAKKAVTEMGGIVRTSPTKKTDICIVGTYDPTTLCDNATIGKKLQIALDLKEQGCDIEIMCEETFLEILSK